MRRNKNRSQKRRSAAAVNTMPKPRRTALVSPCRMETQTEAPLDGAIQTGSAAFDALMLAITTCQSTLTVKIDHVQTETALIRWDIDKFRVRDGAGETGLWH